MSYDNDENVIMDVTAPDRRAIHIIFFLFLNENIYCGYSLEVPQRGTSNEYPQYIFSLRNKKKIAFFFQSKHDPSGDMNATMYTYEMHWNCLIMTYMH